MEKFDLSEVNRLIRQRRSIYPKMFSDEVIPDGIIKEMLENANWAPTHKLTEPWRFVVFAGDGLKKFAQMQGDIYKKRWGKKADTGTIKKLSQKPLLCSHIISIGMKRHKEVPKMEELAAVAMAVQNMWLTASAHGIGCYWSTGGVTYFDEANEFFGLGKKDKLMGFLYLGIPKDNKWSMSKRKSMDMKVEWVR